VAEEIEIRLPLHASAATMNRRRRPEPHILGQFDPKDAVKVRSKMAM